MQLLLTIINNDSETKMNNNNEAACELWPQIAATIDVVTARQEINVITNAVSLAIGIRASSSPDNFTDFVLFLSFEILRKILSIFHEKILTKGTIHAIEKFPKI